MTEGEISRYEATIREFLIGHVATRRGWSTPDHEAAHVVVARHYGRQAFAVSVIPDEITRGRVHYSDGSARNWAETVERERGDRRRRGADRSIAAALISVLYFPIDWRGIRAHVRRLTAEATEVIERPENWCAMKRLSAELARRRELGHESIVRCLEESDRRCAAGDYSIPFSAADYVCAGRRRVA